MDYTGSASGLAATGGVATLFGFMPVEQAAVFSVALILVGAAAVIARSRFRRGKKVDEES